MNKPAALDDLELSRVESLVGRSIVRPNARKHTEGRGRFLDDIKLPRMAHVAFLRSPHARARIVAINDSAAACMPGVIHIATGKDIAAMSKPYVGVLKHMEGLRSPPQYPMAVEFALWQGEPVVAVVAETRAQAEDAIEAIDITWEVLPAAADMERALDPSEPVIHKSFASNLCYRRVEDTGGVDEAFAQAHVIVEDTVQIGRHTGVPLESRGLIAAFNSADRELTVYHSHQSPHMMQGTFATCLSLDEHNVRVIAPDLGGGFGIKVHTYGDEIAVCALAMIVDRPVKFVADRFESFQSDIHARDHRVKGRLAVDREGNMLALEIDDLTGIGPYSMHPRSSSIEGTQVLLMTGGAYKHKLYRGRVTVVFQNKNMMCQYRGVGHPVAFATIEHLVDQAAIRLGIDPAEMRKRNLIPDEAYPHTSPTKVRFEILSHQKCLAKLLKLMDYDALREQQTAFRRQGVYRGIGLSSFFELTNPSPMIYGMGGARIGTQESCTIRLDAGGAVVVHTAISELGQGAETIVAQIAATAVGVDLSSVKVVSGIDTVSGPTGSGSWASRQTGIVGEAVLQAGRALKSNILEVAAVVMQASKEQLDIVGGSVVMKDSKSGGNVSLLELARIAYYRGNELPATCQPQFMATHQFRIKDYDFVFSNGAVGCLLEIDSETGFIELLKMWCVDDCGRAINPKLVDEQVRGGMAQGIGPALLEHCIYDDQGQLLNCTMADYLLPTSLTIPDIEIGHEQTLTKTSALGAKGIGEAGTSGAPAAVMNAVNDALRPFNAKVTRHPITPEVMLEALGKINRRPEGTHGKGGAAPL
jgi:aerobic carbon-monoxide dehydrogenase large subunit